jgi:hypothetical protein
VDGNTPLHLAAGACVRSVAARLIAPRRCWWSQHDCSGLELAEIPLCCCRVYLWPHLCTFTVLLMLCHSWVGNQPTTNPFIRSLWGGGLRPGNNRAAAVKLLLVAGANSSAVNRDGDRPVDAATKFIGA